MSVWYLLSFFFEPFLHSIIIMDIKNTFNIVAFHIVVMAACKNNNVSTCPAVHNGRAWMLLDNILYKS